MAMQPSCNELDQPRGYELGDAAEGLRTGPGEEILKKKNEK